MKRQTLTILLLAAVLVPAAAQTDASALLRKLQGKRVSFDFSLNTADKVSVKHSGNAVVEGACYHIVDNGLELWCDGTSRWTVDSSAKEVYIEPKGQEEEMLVSPSRLLSNVKDLVTGSTTASGKYTGEGPGKGATFVLTSIKTSSPKGDPSEFAFDVSALDKSWIITDLR